jgi:hypothetical protein
LLNEKKVNTVIGQQYQQNKQSTSHLNNWTEKGPWNMSMKTWIFILKMLRF